MIYFILTETFKKNFKRLGKKYPSIKEDLSKIMKSLSENPEQGVLLSDNFRKIRLPIRSKACGKRGGARVITFCVSGGGDVTITLVAIYDKSDLENISDLEIKRAYEY